VEGPRPNFLKRWRGRRKEVDGWDVLDGMFLADFVGGLGAIGAAIAVGILVLALLPLVGIALELVVLLLLVGYGLFARTILRRPWVVEAGTSRMPRNGWPSRWSAGATRAPPCASCARRSPPPARRNG
jgi:hypothetical protein